MLKAAILHGLQQRITTNFFGCCIYRNFKSDPRNLHVPGGGLQKLQGTIREEKYFNSQDLELITKIRKHGSNLKCEDFLGNWAEFEKMLKITAFRYTCTRNKYKDCLEEAFFLNEQKDCLKLLQNKLENENPTKIRQNVSGNIGNPVSNIENP